MQYGQSDIIYGVPHGIFYGQNERVDELNERCSSRLFADTPLQPNFTPRSVSTKYSLFPIVDLRKSATEPYQSHLEYSMKTNFAPITSRGPVSGYMNHVNDETNLRNLGTAMQHGADQGIYVPSSTSDLYNVSVVSRPSEQPFPNLFRKENYQGRNVQSQLSHIGNDRFFNHTRTQLRNEVAYPVLGKI